MLADVVTAETWLSDEVESPLGALLHAAVAHVPTIVSRMACFMGPEIRIEARIVRSFPRETDLAHVAINDDGEFRMTWPRAVKEALVPRCEGAKVALRHLAMSGNERRPHSR